MPEPIDSRFRGNDDQGDKLLFPLSKPHFDLTQSTHNI